MLELPSLQGSRVLVGQAGLSNLVKQLNVLEAPDLAPWLAPGTVLLTSYFALAGFDDSALDSFIEQMSKASVSAIIIKLDRLVSEAPRGFLHACDKYNMPVIAIDRDARYENIIMEALLPLVHHKASLLDRHYRMNVVLDQWRLEDHSLEQTLAYCADLVGHDLTIENIPNQQVLTTVMEPSDEYVLSEERQINDNFAGFAFDVQTMAHRGSRLQSSQRIVVPINLGTEPMCQLIVHSVTDQSEELVIALEHIARYLHIELLSQRNFDNLMYFNRNNLVDELLTNEELKPRNLEGILRVLGLGISPRYQVVQVTLLPASEENTGIAQIDGSADHDHHDVMRIRNYLKDVCANSVFHVARHRLAMIFNIPPGAKALTAQRFAKCLPDDLGPYVAGISDVGGLQDLRTLREQTQQIKDIQKTLKRYSKPMVYAELGILKLFDTPEAMGRIREYIPRSITAFHRKYPVLFDTAVTYLEQGRNTQRCAEELVVHPKTVQYRLGRIRELNLVDLDDSDETLQILFASRVLPRTSETISGGP
ncbi:MAG: PucR family transcriptional regulator [Actinomycetaceae bacterium]|nr:PucR family transcriptional regulator [Actinomycetaceae bacterium]